jgi:hypothetical protein
VSFRWLAHDGEVTDALPGTVKNVTMSRADPATPPSGERPGVSRRRIAINFLTLATTNVSGPAVLPPLLCSAAAVGVIAALPRRLDHLCWLELAGGALMVGVCMLLLERHRLRYAW